MDSELATPEEIIVPELDYTDPPAGSDRRTFMTRSAMATAIATLGGGVNPLWAQTPANAQPVKLDPNLQVAKNEKGPVMTLVDEFYKVGPGPSSSHTIGPMRITYDFYQRAPNCRNRSSTRLRRSGLISSAVSARPAKDTARSGPRWPASSVTNRRRSIRCFLDKMQPSRTRFTRSSLERRPSTRRSRTSSTMRPRATSRTPTP